MSQDVEAIHQMKVDMAGIKKDIGHISHAVNKMEVSFQSLVDLNRNMALQEARFKTLQHEFGRHEATLKTQIESDSRFRDKVEQKFSDLEESSRVERRSLHVEIVDKLDEVAGSLKRDFQSTKDVVDKHDRWIWYIAGIGAVLIFLLNMLPLWDMFKQIAITN